MKYIIIARHTNNRNTGDEGKKPTDGPITDIGKIQAKEMQEFLEKYKFDSIFTSLYLRSIQTAEIINGDTKVPCVKTNAFNEYMMRENGESVEGVDTAKSRTMTKLYSIFDHYDSILVVAHSSIDQTIYQSLTNIKYEDSIKLFKNYGEVRVLRYDYKMGDSNWIEIENFIPKQD